MKTTLLSWLFALLFLAGVLLQLSLSGGVVWEEVEANLYLSQTGGGLALNCPIMMSPSERGLVTTTVLNTIDVQVLPVVTAEISRSPGPQILTQTLTLDPHQTQFLQWPVDASDVIFGRLILVNVNQARYGDLDSRQGSCGIMVLNLFDLPGNASLILILISGFVFIFIGGFAWYRVHAPLDDLAEQTFKACALLSGVTTLGMLTALPRWWGVSLFLDVFALIMLSVIFTEFVLFPKRST
jgi:hypothetical protein